MDIYDLSQRFEDLKKHSVKHLDIHISDNKRFVTEECIGIEMIDENTVKIRTALGIVAVTGLDLKLKNYSSSGLVITGKLHSIEFENN